MGNNSIGDVLTIPHFELLNLDKTTKNNIGKDRKSVVEGKSVN